MPHYVHRLVENKEFKIKQILNSKMLANSLTKAFFIETFKRYQGK